jgi:hypothetical protein
MKTPANIPLPLLTHNQRSALAQYALMNGRRWKAKLSAKWMKAEAAHDLMLVRNRLGPTWLHNVCPSNASEIAALPVIERCPTCGAHASSESLPEGSDFSPMIR